MLLKLTRSDLRDIYINTNNICTIREAYKDPNNGNVITSNSGVTLSAVYDEPGNTIIELLGGQVVYIDEHLAEVLALIEDRDPRPARILYGKKDK